MKKNLTVLDRITLLQLTPEKGDIVTLRVIAQLRTKLAFKEDKIKKNSIEMKEKQITWDGTKNSTFDMDFTEKEIEIITKSLNAVSDAGELNLNQVSLFEKFIEGETK